MSALRARCLQCGNRIPDTLRVCPFCGAEQTSPVPRIRCRTCGWRVPSSALVCPHCHHNPRRFYLSPGTLGLVLLLGGTAVLLYAVFGTSFIGTLAFSAQATPTVLSAPQPLVVATVARPQVALQVTRSVIVPPSRTPTLVPVPTEAGYAEVSPTATAPPTSTATPTATRRPPTPRPTSTQTPLPPTPLPPLPVPILLGPPYGTVFSSANEPVIFSFRINRPLAANQWFRVQVDYQDRQNYPISWCGWSRSGTLQFPSDYYDNSWQLPTRQFVWHVNLIETTVAAPETCAAQVDRWGAPSYQWMFYWY